LVGTATTAAGRTGSWVAATANLAGLPSECGNVTLISASPASDTVIAGVAAQGLWQSENVSSTWTRLGGGPSSAQITNRPSSITYDPDHPGTFWESGIYGGGGGAYETQDNGATFRQLGSLYHSDFVSVDLSDPLRRTLLSGKHEQSSLFRSTDGGGTWADLSSNLPGGIGFTLAPLVLSAQVNLLGTANGSAAGVYRTADGGATWSRVYPVGVAGPALVARSDGAIYWLLEQGKGIIKSTDHGLTWQFLGFESSSSGSLIELPNGWLAGVGRNVVVSPNHGVTWNAIGPPLPFTASGLAYSPSRQSFYAWRSDCTFTGNTSVKADAIMRLSVNLPAK
jgi:photosystem II stability/assembly factor-like uncharacterized protein